MKPRLLDLYCCEGGASRGYDQAGFDVDGVDLFRHMNASGKMVGYSQSRYPYPSHKGDALEFLAGHWPDFDAIHASPPCQRHTAGTRAQDRDRYPDLIGPTRDLLIATGKPYVIENVEGAPLLNPVTLCGTHFGLTAIDDDGTKLYLRRHRLFESNVTLEQSQCQHPADVQWAGSYGGARRDKGEARNVRHGGYVPAKRVQAALLGVDWMTERGMHQCLPPVYTRWVGWQIMEAL